MADKNNTIKTIVELETSDAQKSIKKLGNESSKAMDETAKATKSVGDASGKAKKGIEALDGASGGLLTRFKGLATNPIGLVLAALAGIFVTLKAAVARSGKATETFNKIGAKLGAVLNGLLAVLEPVVEFLGDKLLSALNDPKQAMIDLGDAIKENLINRIKSFMVVGESFALLLKGEFKKAAQKGADALIQFTTGITDGTDKIKEFGKEAAKNFEEAAKAAEALANSEIQLVRNRIALEKQQLISLRLAEEQRQIRDDEARSIDERIAANIKLGQILETQATRELQIAQQNLDIARLQQIATGDTIGNIEAVGDAEIKLLEIRERITGQRSEQLVNENSLLKEKNELKLVEIDAALEEAELQKEKLNEAAELSREKFEADLERQIEYDEIELERKKMNGEATNEVEAEIVENKSQILISQAQNDAEQIELIEEQKKLALDKIKAASKKATVAKNDAELKSTISSAAEAFGIQQEVEVANMIMKAPAAVGNSFAQAAKNYAPPLSIIMGAVGAAATVIPIVKGLSDIKKVRFSKSKGGSSGGSISSTSTGGGGASAITPEVVSDLAANNSARLGVDTSIGSAAGGDASNNISGSVSNSVVFSESSYSSFKDQVEFKESKSTI